LTTFTVNAVQKYLETEHTASAYLVIVICFNRAIIYHCNNY